MSYGHLKVVALLLCILIMSLATFFMYTANNDQFIAPMRTLPPQGVKNYFLSVCQPEDLSHKVNYHSHPVIRMVNLTLPDDHPPVVQNLTDITALERYCFPYIFLKLNVSFVFRSI